MLRLQLFIADWLSRHHHETNRDKEISGMCITINAIESCTDIPGCITAEEIRVATLDDQHLGILSEHVFHILSSTKAEVQKELQHTGHSETRSQSYMELSRKVEE